MPLSCTYAQLSTNTMTEAMFEGQIEQLRKELSVKKILVAEFELASLIGLSKYPELKELRIDVIYSKIKTTMEARPTLSSVFKRKSRRHYKVVINSNEQKLGKAALKNVPFDAQVGVLAHEFAHIRMYNTKNVFGLIGIGISYFVSKRFREKFEKENDRETINRGYGWQVYHFTDYILNETDVSEKYKKYKRRIYYEPEEVKELIKGNQ